MALIVDSMTFYAADFSDKVFYFVFLLSSSWSSYLFFCSYNAGWFCSESEGEEEEKRWFGSTSTLYRYLIDLVVSLFGLHVIASSYHKRSCILFLSLSYCPKLFKFEIYNFILRLISIFCFRLLVMSCLELLSEYKSGLWFPITYTEWLFV